ncbi:MAG: RDD family protein [Verrucomicrobia bacterium]|nr:RDD family protein [Verrucomicrobiota bacterium]
MTERSGSLEIRTPEGIAFALPLAGPVARFLAWAIDLAVISTVSMVAGRLLNLLRVVSDDTAAALNMLLFFGLWVGYGIAMEWRWRGQTLGKRVLRLRVVDERGLRLRPVQIAVRNLLRFVDQLPAFYMVGGCAMVLSRHAQRLGDLAGNTVVIRTPPLVMPDVEQILAGRYNTLRTHPHLEARLRRAVPPAAAALALRALLRRDEMDDEPRVALFRALAAHLRDWVTLPPDLVRDLSDEQFVRNCVDSLYRRPGGKT